MAPDVSEEAADLAMAWDELMTSFPNRERWPQVRVTLRRKTGQVLCAVEKTQRTGSTPAEAIRAVANAIRAGVR